MHSQQCYWWVSFGDCSYIQVITRALCTRTKTGCYLLWFFIRTATTITENPVSVTALIGTNAQFHCAGTGNYLAWEVDGLQADHSKISAHGITSNTTTDSGIVQSTLTVPATPVNNGTIVRCAIRLSLISPPVVSNYSTLTVLPGKLPRYSWTAGE